MKTQTTTKKTSYRKGQLFISPFMDAVIELQEKIKVGVWRTSYQDFRNGKLSRKKTGQETLETLEDCIPTTRYEITHLQNCHF